jgi:hypothetical protein
VGTALVPPALLIKNNAPEAFFQNNTPLGTIPFKETPLETFLFNGKATEAIPSKIMLQKRFY